VVPGAPPAEIGEIFADWNKGDLDSFLVEIDELLAHLGVMRWRIG
jgi:6-phosphogluconate dehydrogenase